MINTLLLHFNNLAPNAFNARLPQANVATKIDFGVK